MLNTQGEIKFSEHAVLYDMLIPADNKYRLIDELIDFSFIYDELKDKYCLDNGRKAADPIMLFKYLMIKVIDNFSDVDVVEHSRYDLSYKRFLGLMPEDNVIDPSLLTKFRRQRLKDVNLLDMLIAKTVGVAIEKGIITSKSIIVDATHTIGIVVFCFCFDRSSRLVPSISAFRSPNLRFYISIRSFRPDFLSIVYDRGVVPPGSAFLCACFRFRRPPAVLSVLSCPPAAPRLPCGCRRRCTGFPSASSGP